MTALLCRTSRESAQGALGPIDHALDDLGCRGGASELCGLSRPQRHKLRMPLSLRRRAHVLGQRILHGKRWELFLVLAYLDEETVLYATSGPAGEGERDGRLVFGSPQYRLLEHGVGTALLAREKGGSHLGGFGTENEGCR